MAKQRGGMTVFLCIYGIVAAAVSAVLMAGYLLIEPGLALYAPVLTVPAFAAASFGAAAVIVLYLMLWASVFCRPVPLAARPLLGYLRLTFPTAKKLAACLHRKDAVCRAYISFLNRMVLSGRLRVAPEHVLVLVPHCLQWDQCPHKITRNVHNCRQCGHCPIGDIVAMTDSLHTAFAVASGGTLARQIIREQRPQAIIAIACERDLISGLEDVFPLPAVGLLNSLPYGPCLNTDVDLAALRRLIDMITGEHHECTRNSLAKSSGNLPGRSIQ